MKNIIWLAILIVLGVIVYGAYLSREEAVAPSPEETPIVDETNTKEYTYKNATEDNIKVTLPFPGAVTGKEFTVVGTARGSWYFEATFPIDVLDKDGKLLVAGYATAQGEWMTTEFVPFKAEIKVPESYIGPATLVLKNSNASGEPERDAYVSFPFTIEY